MKARGRIGAIIHRLRPSRRVARGLISRADRARDGGRFAEAAALYDEVVRILPRHGAIHVQAGHMRKEIGDFEIALAHYRRAEELMHDNADLALQIGHFFKKIGKPVEAVSAYRKALRLNPSESDAIAAIKNIERDMPASASGDHDDVGGAWSQALEAGLVPQLMPEYAIPYRSARDRIVLRRAGGREEPGIWGRLPTVHGVGSVRGHLISRKSFDTVSIALDGTLVRSETPIRNRLPDGDIDHVFNIWFDAAHGPGPGRRMLEVSFIKDGVAGPMTRATIVIADNIEKPADDERDDVFPAGDRPDDVEGWIRALPSEVRLANRSERASPRSILVLRVDQLGDLVVSVPALKRLRELTGNARLVGLLTHANADLARSLNLFDEVLIADFPLDPVSRERVMSAADQMALRTILKDYNFDAAIDLGTSHMSRPLLMLSGAPNLYGVATGQWAWLDARLRSPSSGSSTQREAPHSERLMRIVERFGADVDAIATRPILRRAENDDSRLGRLGLAPRAYVVLHESVGHGHNRWPGFVDLLRLLLDATRLDVAFLTDAPDRGAAIATLSGRERVRLFDSRLAFDDLDALLANAAVFAGIDSGPKHLAALRGVPVVSIHSSRSDWREWGQEQTGLIVSRRLPCAGCGIGHHDHACGKGFACIVDIRAEEVCSCILSLLPNSGSGGQGGAGSIGNES